MKIEYTSYANMGPATVQVRSFPMLDLLPTGENWKWKQSGTRTPNCHYEGYTSLLATDTLWVMPLSWTADPFHVELGAAL